MTKKAGAAKKTRMVKKTKVSKTSVDEFDVGKVITAVYVGDSRNYHIYQLAGNEGTVVGGLYFSKKEEVPRQANLALLTTTDKEWRPLVEVLQANAREGSKNYDRLTSILAG